MTRAAWIGTEGRTDTTVGGPFVPPVLRSAFADSPPVPRPTRSAAGSTAPGGRPGIGDPVDRATRLLADLLATLDPARLSGPDAAELYRKFAAVERLSMAGKTLLAPRIDESGVWRDGGHRSPAVMLAELEGVPTGQARNTLQVGHRLPDLPGTEEALRSGVLSGPKVAELSGAAVLDPGSEGGLLDGAADQPLHEVRERCQRARAEAERHDPLASVRRIHAARHFSSWTDADGAFCYQGRDTADRGARILQHMRSTVDRLRNPERSARSGAAPSEAERPTEQDRALRADAFFLLMTDRSGGSATGRADAHVEGAEDPERGIDGVPGSHVGIDGDVGASSRSGRRSDGPAGPEGRPGHVSRSGPDGPDLRFDPVGARPDAGVVEQPPTCSVMVRVDLEALLRGHVQPGEVCEIDDQGPIPVPMARDLANDSFLRLVFHRAGDIRAVSHWGRTINRRLRTALAHRDRCCVVPGCGVSFGLEIDHVVPFAQGGPTELSNLALLCHHHHYLKTYEGWTLSRHGTADDGSPIWEFVPMPAFGEEPDPESG